MSINPTNSQPLASEENPAASVSNSRFAFWPEHIAQPVWGRDQTDTDTDTRDIDQRVRESGEW
jgi:hypothetical protein